LTLPATIISTYPPGLTSESAFYACDGPKDQQIAELKRIVAACAGHETPEALTLHFEAESRLEAM